MPITDPLQQTLDKIDVAMEALIEGTDTEEAHQQADALLVQTVEALIEEGAYDRVTVQSILTNYSRIGKWYA